MASLFKIVKYEVCKCRFTIFNRYISLNMFRLFILKIHPFSMRLVVHIMTVTYNKFIVQSENVHNCYQGPKSCLQICFMLLSMCLVLNPLDKTSLLSGLRREKTGLWGFQSGLTQTGLYSHRKRLEA